VICSNQLSYENYVNEIGVEPITLTLEG
jgi:hypothetical protein